jgi:hypothetical protein
MSLDTSHFTNYVTLFSLYSTTLFFCTRRHILMLPNNSHVHHNPIFLHDPTCPTSSYPARHTDVTHRTTATHASATLNPVKPKPEPLNPEPQTPTTTTPMLPNDAPDESKQ